MANIQVTHSASPVNARSESCIAVNPLNSTQIVACSKEFRNLSGFNNYNFTLAAYYSSDGGITWSDSQALIPLKGWGGVTDPSLAWDNQGNVYLLALPVAFNPVSSIGMSVYKSTDGGKSWGTPKLIHQSAGDDKQWIAGDPNNGNLYAVWDDISLLRFSRSLDQGATWQGIQNEAGPSILYDNSYSPEVNLAPNGDVYIFFSDDDDIRFVKSTDGGNTFSDPTAANALIASGVGNLEDVFSTGVGLTHFPGATFRVETLVTGCCPTPNNIVVAWPDARGTNKDGQAVSRILYNRSVDGGATWEGVLPLQPENIIPENSQQFCPQITCTKNGVVGCTFYEFGPHGAKNKNLIDVKLTTSSDKGKTFSAAAIVTDQPWDPAIDAPMDEHGNTFIGDYFGIDAKDELFIPCWTDTRTKIQEIFVDTSFEWIPVVALESLRLIRGTVNFDGTWFAGRDFVCSKYNDSNGHPQKGLYLIIFGPWNNNNGLGGPYNNPYQFPSVPSGSVTQVYQGDNHFDLNQVDAHPKGGNTRDNAVIVRLQPDHMIVKTGDDGGNASDRAFSFIVVGPR
jgi:hypothetical protein